MTLTEFLAARLDEDEAAARTADSSVWPSREVQIELDDPEHFAWRGKELSPAMAAHIVRHGPARVLREVAAGRKLLAALEASPDPEQHPRFDPVEPAYAHAAGMHDGLLLAVKIRAADWSDHPDYDRAWAA